MQLESESGFRGSWLYKTRAGRLAVSLCAGAICLPIWLAQDSLASASGVLFWMGVAIRFLGWMAWWVALWYFIGAIVGPRMEIDFSSDGEGD